jgi:hypothetical protein
MGTKFKARRSAMPDRTREILEDLEAVRENLLALSDEIWQSIDHNDPEGLEEGVRFKRAYNEKMAAFDTLASELSAMVQQFTSVRLGEHEEIGGEDESENVRIIQALNQEEPHSIDEDFTFKRPYGFMSATSAARSTEVRGVAGESGFHQQSGAPVVQSRHRSASSA